MTKNELYVSIAAMVFALIVMCVGLSHDTPKPATNNYVLMYETTGGTYYKDSTGTVMGPLVWHSSDEIK